MPDSLVTVTAYPERDDAKVAQGALDAAGIEAVVDEPAERKARVRVDNVDAIRAGDVLTRTCDALTEIDEPDEEETSLTCPECGSLDASSSRRGEMFLLVAAVAVAVGVGAGATELALFLIAVTGVLLLIRGRWRCNACGETFD